MNTGLDFPDQFHDKPDAVAGQEIVARHFPAGQTLPVEIVANAGSADQVGAAARRTAGVGDVLPAERSTDGQLVRIPVALTEDDPKQAGEIVDRLRAAVRAVPGADAKVGGEPAATHDIAIASKHDRTWVPLLVPMLAIDLGERFWWPGRPSARRRPAHRAPAEVRPHAEPRGSRVDASSVHSRS